MLLHDYLKEIGLPNPKIEPHTNVSRSFLEKGILTLWDAIEYVYKLPYGLLNRIRECNCEDDYRKLLPQFIQL